MNEGWDRRFIEDINAIFREEIDDRRFTSGANILVLKHGEELLYHEYGWRDKENRLPFSRDTIMRLYSMSKPITAAAVMLLVDRGALDLGTCLCWSMPGFGQGYAQIDSKRHKTAQEITVKDLLNMTSGIPYPGGEGASLQSAAVFSELIGRMNTDNPMTTAEFSRRIGECDLCFSPGDRFMYGASADILGALVEQVSGMSFGEFLKKELFEPLEMSDTGFWVPEEKRHRLARIYMTDYAAWQVVPAPQNANHLGINYAMDKPPAFESGGAGLVSTLDDYAKFALMLLNKGEYKGRRILSKRAVEYMTSPSLMPWQLEELSRGWRSLSGFSYGNLMRVCTDPGQAYMLCEKGEYGWDGWLGCYFSNSPESGLTFLLGMQRTDCGTSQLTRRLINRIRSELS